MGDWQGVEDAGAAGTDVSAPGLLWRGLGSIGTLKATLALLEILEGPSSSCEEGENASRGKARQPGLMGFKAWLPHLGWEGACVPGPAEVGVAGGIISICCHLLSHRGQVLGQHLPELRYISNIPTSPALGALSPIPHPATLLGKSQSFCRSCSHSSL